MGGGGMNLDGDWEGFSRGLERWLVNFICIDWINFVLVVFILFYFVLVLDSLVG